MKSINAKKQESGFVILFAVIIAAIIFALGAGLFSSARKETLLSSTTSESQIALGVIDAGAECALHYAFINSGPGFSCAGSPSQSGVTCGTTNQGTCFKFDMRALDPNNSACGIVSITPNVTNNGGSVLGTRIQVRGFNVCTMGIGGSILSPDVNDPLLIERKFIIWYADAPAPLGNNTTNGQSGGGAPVI